MAQRVVVLDTDLGYNKILKEILDNERSEILIGIQQGSKTHYQTKNGRVEKAGIDIAQYAAMNEFGTDSIPERSFIRSAFDMNIELINDLVYRQIGLAIDQDISIDVAYNRIGLGIQSLVQRRIRDIRTPPNSPKTIKIKGSSNPLIDFGQMIQAVRYVIKKI